ncbi:MAG: HAMP domain-containing histidine kinase [Lachnospiraceae bacterium]|nr:HAMP domain-containing histidine kinase [Lachnospiraceae bacterium]
MILRVVIFLLAIGAGILSVRLWRYGKQIKHIERQLQLLITEDTNYQLTSAVPVGRTNEVIADFNQILEKYRLAGQELQQINRSYRESITGISHDIRTPLTSIKGYVQMVRDPGISQEKKEEYLEIIEGRLVDLTEILDQLFEYARIEAGELQLKTEKLNAGNLFAETLSMFYEDFVKKGCDPEVKISEKPCFIWGDAHAFVRILENLMKNALVHGTGFYEFLMFSEQSWIVIRISNETETIARKDLDQIFERFYTTDQSGSRKGTGLGLAIAREFTEQMGGEIQAYFQEKRFAVEVRFPASFSFT